MKKLLCVLFVVLILSETVDAAEKRLLRLGLLSKLNTTEQEFSRTWQKTFAPAAGELEVRVKFYDTLPTMQMALNAGEIHQMVLPEAVANYVLALNEQAEAALVLPADGMGLAFGFRGEDEQLRDKFNAALASMREDWTLATVEGVYTASAVKSDPEPVKFSVFPGARTLKAAVTGDLPPIDYIAPDGTPAGFNTAVLAEIGRRLQVNIELVAADAGARSAALSSKRVDVVFWYEVNTASQVQHDIPEGVIISKPYYEWHKFIHIKKAAPKAADRWNIVDEIRCLFFLGR